MYCKNLLKRQRKYKPYFYCKALRKKIILPCDKNCSKLILVANKPIKKVSSKRITVTEETYNKVMQRDKGRCRLCGTSLNLHLHHIDGRGKDLTNNINNCIFLCENCHLNIVHKNQKKYRPILKEMIKND